VLGAANFHGSNVFEELVDTLELIKHPGEGRPRKRPAKPHVGKGYNAGKCRQALRRRGIKSRVESGRVRRAASGWGDTGG